MSEFNELHAKGLHKNRFRFVSFSDRIGRIDVSALQRLGAEGRVDADQAPEDAPSFFVQRLNHWRDLNVTASYAAFLVDVVPLVSSLPLLLHNKDRVTDALLKHLAVKDSMCHAALLELLAMLARDLRHEMLPLLPRILPALFNMVEPSNPELVEHVFNAVGFLFKFLQRPLLDRLPDTLSAYTSILSHRRGWVRKSAAEAFSFLIRKQRNVDNLRGLVRVMFSLADTQDAMLCEGLAQLMFETVRGVSQRFHSCADTLVPMLLAMHRVMDNRAAITRVLTSFLRAACEHTSRQRCGVVWTAILRELDASCNAGDAATVRAVDFLALWLAHRNGSRIPDYAQACDVVSKILPLAAKQQCPSPLRNAVFSALAVLLRNPFTSDEVTAQTPILLQRVLGMKHLYTQRAWLSLIVTLHSLDAPRAVVDAQLPRLLDRLAASQQHVVLLVLASLEHPLPLHAKSAATRVLTESLSSSDAPVARVALQLLRSHALKARSDMLSVLLRRFAADTASSTEQGSVLLALATVCDMSDDQSRAAVLALLPQLLDRVLPTAARTTSFLAGVDALLDALPTSDRDACLRGTDLRDTILAALAPCLGDAHDVQRRAALGILARLPVLQYDPPSGEDKQSILQGDVDIIAWLYQLETTPATLALTRERDQLWRRIESTLHSRRVPPALVRLVAYACFGTLRVRFAAAWPVVHDVAATAAATYPHVFWPVMLDVLQQLHADAAVAAASSTSSEEDPLAAAAETRMAPIPLLDVMHSTTHVEADSDIDDDDDNAAAVTPDDVAGVVKRAVALPDATDAQTMLRSVLQMATKPSILALVHQHSQQVLTLFWQFIDAEYVPAYEQGTSDAMVGSRKLISSKLVLWLELVAALRRPRKVYQPDRLHAFALRLLLRTEPTVQQLALQIVLNWQVPGQMRYRENLARLIADASYRDEMALFAVAPTTVAIDHDAAGTTRLSEEDRAVVAPLVLRILYGKMFQRKGRSSARTSMTIRRSAVLSYVATMPELPKFIDLLLAPYAAVLDADVDGPDAMRAAAAMPAIKLLGCVSVLGDVCKQLNTLVEPHLDQFIKLLVVFLRHAANPGTDKEDDDASDEDTGDGNDHDVDDDGDDAGDGDSDDEDASIAKAVLLKRQTRQLRTQCFRRIASILAGFPSHPWSQALLDTLVDVARPRLVSLPSDNISNPSGLLICLSVMARTPSLLPVFASLQPLPHILACMRADIGALRVLSVVFDVLEALLSPDAEAVLVPHVPLVLQQLQQLFTQHFVLPSFERPRGAAARKRAQAGAPNAAAALGPFVKRELAVLSAVSRHVSDPDTAQTLCELLLPFLGAKSRAREDAKVSILRTLAALMPSLPRLDALLPLLARQFLLQRDRSTLQALCDVWIALAQHRQDLLVVAPLLQKLHAYDARAVDRVDFDARIAAYGMLSTRHIAKASSIALQPVCFVAVRDMENDELALRNAAGLALAKVVHRARDAGFQALVSTTLMPMLLKLLAHSRNELVRGETLRVISEVAQAFPQRYPDLATCVTGLDTNILQDMTALQRHRRMRAVVQLQTLIRDRRVQPRTVTTLITPMFMHLFYETGGDAGEHNIVDEAVATLAAAARQMPWRMYRALLFRQLRQIPLQPAVVQRRLVKLAVAILDAFHFETADVDADEALVAIEQAAPPSAAAADADTPGKEEEEEGEGEGEGDDEGDDGDAGDDSEDEDDDVADEADAGVVQDASPAEIARDITTRVLPRLYLQLGFRQTRKQEAKAAARGSADSLRVPVALAIVKLLQALPPSLLEQQLPKLMLSLVGYLSSREQSTRDSACSTLVQVTSSLGPGYLHYAAQELQRSLTRGYQQHVLGYAMHAVLEGVVVQAKAPPGSIDHALPVITDVLWSDLTGDVANQKSVAKIAAQYREARVLKSFDSFELLARVIDFRTGIRPLLQDVVAQLDQAETRVAVRRCDEVLRRISIGLIVNKSLTPEDLLLFTHTLVSENLAQQAAEAAAVAAVQPGTGVRDGMRARGEIAAAERSKDSRLLEPVPNLRQPFVPTHLRDGNLFKRNRHLLSEFALQLMNSLLKRNFIDTQNPAQLGMLDPFCELMQRALASPHTELVQRALAVLVWLLRCPLSSRASTVPQITAQIFTLLEDAGGNTSTPLVQACFRVVVVIVRDVGSHSLSQAQLRVLVTYIATDLDVAERQVRCFTLLKAVLSQRVVVPEIYDLMDSVARLMVTSYASTVRSSCGMLLIQFLLDYPLVERKRSRMLQQILANLDFREVQGREAVLELLQQLFTRAPAAMIASHAEFFFVPVALRIVADDDATCREMAATAVRTLLSVLDTGKQHALLQLTWRWAGAHDRPAARRLAAQLISVFVSVAKEPRRVVLHWRESIFRELGLVLSRHREVEPALLYTVLATLESLLAAEPRLLDAADAHKALLGPVSYLVLHKHAWVRRSVARLFGAYFASSSGDWVRGNAERFSRLLRMFCRQLESAKLDEATSDQVVKNILWMSRQLDDHPQLYQPWVPRLSTGHAEREAGDGDGDVASDGGDEEDDDDEEEEEEEEKDMGEEEEADDDDCVAHSNKRRRTDAGKVDVAVPGNKGLRWLVQRLSLLARRDRSAIQTRLAVLRAFAAMIMHWKTPDACAPYLGEILRPLHWATEGGDGVPVPVRDLARQVLDLVRETLGAEVYVDAYAAVRSTALRKREKRHRERAVLAVADPKKAAERKEQRLQDKARRRKRKSSEAQLRRGKTASTSVRVKRARLAYMDD